MLFCNVPTVTTIHSTTTMIENMVPKTLKNREGNSLARAVVATVNTPKGNVKPHQPMLNGNLEREIVASAKKSHTSPKPHMIKPTKRPKVYAICPAIGARGTVFVRWKTARASEPSCIMAKPALAERAEWQKDGDDDFTRRQSHHCKSMEVHHQNEHCQGEAAAPEDVADDDDYQSVLGTGFCQLRSYDATGACGNNCRHHR